MLKLAKECVEQGKDRNQGTKRVLCAVDIATGLGWAGLLIGPSVHVSMFIYLGLHDSDCYSGQHGDNV